MFWILVPSFILLDLFWWRSMDRRLRPLRFARAWRMIVAACVIPVILYLFLMLVWPVPIRASGSLVPMVGHIFIYLWHFIMLPLTMMVLAGGAAIKAIRVFRGRHTDRPVVPCATVAGHPPALPAASPRADCSLSRRQVIAAAMTIPPLATLAGSEWSVRHLYGRRLRSFTLPIPHLPYPLDGMTIAHVSDTHIGKFLHPDRLPSIADDINRLDADFITFTGDLIDLALDDLPYGLDFLRRLKSRCGLVICEGNHDIMQSRSEFENQMLAAEFRMLLGDQLTLDYTSRGGRSWPIQFLGVPWNMTDAEMGDAVRFISPTVRRDAFPILLAHHPHSFDAAAEAKIPLVLSGHTHGGQIMLTSQVGAGSYRFRYTSGLYKKPGSALIVNNGLGNWFPLRVNAPAELVHITLKRA